MNNQQITQLNEVFLAVGAVMTFLGIDYYLVTNGYEQAALGIGLLGVILIWWSEQFDKAIPTELVSKKIITTIGHVLLFVSIKIYLEPVVDKVWWLLIITGALLINYGHSIINYLVNKTKK